MKYNEFIAEVQKRAAIVSFHDAEVITEASLATLGERLTQGQRGVLGAQLPKELKGYLGEKPHEDLFRLEEYYNRVSARADMGYPDAVRRSRIVMGVIKDAITEAQLRVLLDILPAEYGELFGQEPTSPLSPTIQL